MYIVHTFGNGTASSIFKLLSSNLQLFNPKTDHYYFLATIPGWALSERLFYVFFLTCYILIFLKSVVFCHKLNFWISFKKIQLKIVKTVP
jgi:hypothetical protein